MNVFLIKYYRYDSDHNLKNAWISCTCDSSKNDALIHGKDAIDRWNNEAKGEFYYTFEPLEYAPVVKENGKQPRPKARGF